MPCCCLSAPQPPKKGWTHAGAAFTSTKPLVHMWGCEKVPLLFSWSRGLWLSLQHLGGSRAFTLQLWRRKLVHQQVSCPWGFGGSFFWG